MVKRNKGIKRKLNRFLFYPDFYSDGISGIIARAAGKNIDLRKNSPYYFYGQIDFKVGLGVSALAIDRLLVTLHEILESLSINQELLKLSLN